MRSEFCFFAFGRPSHHTLRFHSLRHNRPGHCAGTPTPVRLWPLFGFGVLQPKDTLPVRRTNSPPELLLAAVSAALVVALLLAEMHVPSPPAGWRMVWRDSTRLLWRACPALPCEAWEAAGWSRGNPAQSADLRSLDGFVVVETCTALAASRPGCTRTCGRSYPAVREASSVWIGLDIAFM